MTTRKYRYSEHYLLNMLIIALHRPPDPQAFMASRTEVSIPPQ